jgi:hypothetical protein
MKWSEARLLAAQYQSSGSTGSGFATFASTGNVTTELWQNIHYCESASGPGTEEWAADMAKLRALLQEEGYALTAGSDDDIPARLEYLRSQIEAECISTGELIELQGLAEHIDRGDVQLLEWAGVPEFESKLETEGGHRANVAAAALQAYYEENGGPANYGQDTYGDEGNDIFRETLVDLLSDLRHLAFRAGIDFEDCNDAASLNYREESEDWSKES